MKKAAFNIQTFLIGFLVVSGIFVTFGSLAYQMGQDYSTISPSTINGSFSNTYNKIDTIVATTGDIQTKLEQSDVGDSDAATQSYGGVLGATKLVGSVLTISSSMINDMATTLHVPKIWIVIATAVIIIALVTTFIFMLFRV